MEKFALNIKDDAVETAFKEAIEAGQMRLVSHINGQANAARIGKTVPVDQIFEIFRPDFALRVWQAHKPAGIDIPIRLHVYGDGEGKLFLAYKKPSAIFAPYGSAELDAVGQELDGIFANIVERVVSQ